MPFLTPVKIQNAANIATVFAALIAAGSFYYGYLQVKETQQEAREVLELQQNSFDQERDSRAVDLFLKYNELMGQTNSRAESIQNDWRENLAVSIAESVFRLRKDDSGWKETVAWMLSHHIEYLKKARLNCPSFDGDFVKLANEQAKEDLCTPRKSGK